MGIFDIKFGEIFKTVGDTVDAVHTSKEELRQLDIEEMEIFADLDKSQMEVNKVEARHDNIFVAGWRPAIGWTGAIALMYQFVLYPFLVWIWYILQSFGKISTEISAPPVLDMGALMTIITGMLGIAGMRTYEKLKGVNTNKLGKKK